MSQPMISGHAPPCVPLHGAVLTDQPFGGGEVLSQCNYRNFAPFLSPPCFIELTSSISHHVDLSYNQASSLGGYKTETIIDKIAT